MHKRLVLAPVAALVAVIGIAAAVWARAPITPAAVDWRKIEKLCAVNGGYYYRIDGGGACIDTSDIGAGMQGPFRQVEKVGYSGGGGLYRWDREEWCCPSY